MRLVKDPAHSGPGGWPRLLADMGGTHARFAWRAGPGQSLECVLVLPCADFPGPAQAIREYLARNRLPLPASAALAVAVPVVADQVQMTNLSWRFSIEALRAELGLQSLLLLNDFSALALAIPTLKSGQLHRLGPALEARPGPVALLGAGTGLGVSGLLPDPNGSGQWVPIMGEGGHVTLAAIDDLEFEAIRGLQRQYGHVSAERVLSGSGLVDLHRVLTKIQGGTEAEKWSAAEIVAQGMQATSGPARQTLNMFCAWLGSVAGDLALTLGAVGGVYIGGGIAPRLRAFLMASSFRQRFVAKGRYQTYLEAIPTWLIESEVSPALEGADQAMTAYGHGGGTKLAGRVTGHTEGSVIGPEQSPLS